MAELNRVRTDMMAKLRQLGSDLSGSAWFIAIAVWINPKEYAWASGAAMTAWLVAGLWAAAGFVHWMRRDASAVRFRYPRSYRALSRIPLGTTAAKKAGLDHSSRRAKVDRRICDYISSLLDGASRATILTRDMSWGEGAKTSLERLARTGNLDIISCGHHIGVSSHLRELAEMGANLHVIPSEVVIRFTLVGRGGREELALGRPELDCHTILRSRDPDDPVFAAAVELAKSLKREALVGGSA